MDYKDTLNLPVTDFPMKANLASMEVKMLEKWASEDLYGQIMKAGAGKPTFILHDGPPYANGNIHSGHALNKILKDIVVKFKTMTGHHAPFVPGWDCHGLPIEHQVDKNLGKDKAKFTPAEKRRLCREYAEKYVGVQREEFKRLGVLADWDHPYLTMAHDYEMVIIRELIKLLKAGSLYRDFKPVHWCPSCGTALAEAEVEYADHTSPSIYVAFTLNGSDASKLGLDPAATSVVIWTTTPWTLPANLGICLHPEFTYQALKVQDGRTLILAEGLAAQAMAAFGIKDYEVVKTFKGTALERMKARHPFLEKDSLIILGDHVTLEQGTGCVHTAPGHGQEDYIVGLKYGLEVYNPVDAAGRFMPDTPHFAGMKVWEANAPIIEMMKANGSLLAVEKMSHSYPHCWRCRNPIIFRATAQWFVSMEKNGLRQKALETIRGVRWIPAWGEERIFGMVQNRPDWCVSRQRVWGVPIISFFCERCGEALFNEASASHVAELMDKEGVDIWFTKPAAELMPEGSACPACGNKSFTKGQDILDVWFDSGVSHAAVMERAAGLAWPADLYLEGSDQHRGWFHTSLLEAVGTRGAAPYRQALTHGYVVDGAGKKMSKSLGNVIAPQKVIDKYGAEILRLWVASEDYREDIRLSDEILARLVEAYRKIRNTVRFMLGNLHDFDPVKDMVPYAQRGELDRVIVIRLNKLARRVAQAFGDYEFHVFYHALHNFCVTDLSAFYLDIIKDRLYTYPKTSAGRRSAQSSLYEVTDTIIRLMAPVLSFTAEEAYGYLPRPAGHAVSVHAADMPTGERADLDEPLMGEWERLLAIRGEISQALEAARQKKTIGHSLDAAVEISAFQSDYDLLDKRRAELPFIFIVSQVKLVDQPGEGEVYKSERVPGLTARVGRASGAKCARCWNYSVTVGEDAASPLICDRCADHLAAG